MNSLRYLACVIILHLTLPVAVQAQQYDTTVCGLRFTTLIHDFGEAIEGTDLRYVFRFRNVSTEPVIFSRVNTPDPHYADSWPREPVLPGKSSFISVIMPTRGREGRFGPRYVTAVCNKGEFRLGIRGIIVRDSAHDRRFEIDRFGYGRDFDLDTVPHGARITREIEITNTSVNRIGLMTAVNHYRLDGAVVEARLDRPFLKPGEKATLTCTIDTRKFNAPDRKNHFYFLVVIDSKIAADGDTVITDAIPEDGSEGVQIHFYGQVMAE